MNYLRIRANHRLKLTAHQANFLCSIPASRQSFPKRGPVILRGDDRLAAHRDVAGGGMCPFCSDILFIRKMNCNASQPYRCRNDEIKLAEKQS